MEAQVKSLAREIIDTVEADEFGSTGLTWSEGAGLINDVGSERWLARRIQTERKARGMSQADLARAMAEHGHPIHQSAISKVEAPPRSGSRSISIDEAIGFSKVFGIPLGELLLPPDVVSGLEAWRRYRRAEHTKLEIEVLMRSYGADVAYLRSQDVQDLPGFRSQLAEHRARMRAEIEKHIQELEPRWGRAVAERQVDRLGLAMRISVVDEVLTDNPADVTKGWE